MTVYLLVAAGAVVAIALAATDAGALGRASRLDDSLGQGRLPDVDQAMVADLAIAALGSGASIPSALEALDAALDEEAEPPGLAFVARMLVMGAGWRQAWQDVPERFAPLRDALEPAWTDGAAALPLLERAASGVRQGRIRAAREAAASLGAKLVLPLGLCFLPAFVAIGIVPVVVSAGMKLFGWG
ncbi:MAG: type II secretion system F family protein [Actinomycetaceae bacterium]|nr:type II secretion system F family protein [Actinomycetaceae bacterium]